MLRRWSAAASSAGVVAGSLRTTLAAVVGPSGPIVGALRWPVTVGAARYCAEAAGPSSLAASNPAQPQPASGAPRVEPLAFGRDGIADAAAIVEEFARWKEEAPSSTAEAQQVKVALRKHYAAIQMAVQRQLPAATEWKSFDEQKDSFARALHRAAEAAVLKPENDLELAACSERLYYLVRDCLRGTDKQMEAVLTALDRMFGRTQGRGKAAGTARSTAPTADIAFGSAGIAAADVIAGDCAKWEAAPEDGALWAVLRGHYAAVQAAVAQHYRSGLAWAEFDRYHVYPLRNASEAPPEHRAFALRSFVAQYIREPGWKEDAAFKRLFDPHFAPITVGQLAEMHGEWFFRRLVLVAAGNTRKSLGHRHYDFRSHKLVESSLEEPWRGTQKNSPSAKHEVSSVLESGKLVVLAGASGAGKTVAAIRLADEHVGVCVYCCASDLRSGEQREQDEQDAAAARSSSSNDSETPKKQQRGACTLEVEVTIPAGAARDTAVVAAVVDVVQRTVDSLRGQHTLAHDPSARVVIVVDECGSHPHTLRALCAAVGQVEAEVAAALNVTHSRCHVVAVGTGADHAMAAPGSRNTDYKVYKVAFRQWYEFLRANEAPTPLVAAFEEDAELRAAMETARFAAALLHVGKVPGAHLDKGWSARLASLPPALYHAAPATPLGVLLTLAALASVVYKGKNGMEYEEADSATQYGRMALAVAATQRVPNDEDTLGLLLRRFGLLTDEARWRTAGQCPAGWVPVKLTRVEQAVAERNPATTGMQLLAPLTGRWAVPPAVCLMVRLGFGAVIPPPGWAGLEVLLQQLLLCMACLPLPAPPPNEHSQRQHQPQRQVDQPRRSSDAAVVPQEDDDDDGAEAPIPLQFRRWLWSQIAETRVATVVDGGTLMFQLCENKNPTLLDALCTDVKARVHGAPSDASSARGASLPPECPSRCGVVVRNAASAPGPDVIGLFPGLVVLVQAKRLLSKSTFTGIDEGAEFAKMSGPGMLTKLCGAVAIKDRQPPVRVVQLLFAVLSKKAPSATFTTDWTPPLASPSTTGGAENNNTPLDRTLPVQRVMLRVRCGAEADAALYPLRMDPSL